MFRIETAHVAALLATTLAMLSTHRLSAAEVCSAWAEPARIEVQTQLRKERGLRNDQPWVIEVARDPRSAIGDDGIRMLPEEQLEFRSRIEKLTAQAAQRGAQLQPALTYAEQHPDQFAGGYMRRSSDYYLAPPDAFVLRFTADLAAHAAAIRALYVGSVPLEILPARFSLQQLKTVQQALLGYSETGIRIFRTVPDLNNNVVEVSAESKLPDAAARLEAGFDGAVKALIFPVLADSKRVPVTRGTGWRLVGRVTHRGGQPEEATTRLASSAAEWQQLQSVTQLREPLSRVDFSKEIVLTLTTSLGCGEPRLDDIVIDQPLQSITPRFSLAQPAYGACGLAYVGYEVFAVAIERKALPPNPITVPGYFSWEAQQAPDYCPRGLVIPPP